MPLLQLAVTHLPSHSKFHPPHCLSHIVYASLDLEKSMEESIQDIFQRSTAGSENYVRYALYFPEKASSIENLQQICAEIQDLAQQVTSGYIWHKDRFGVSITQSSVRDPPYPFLHGITRFGDCLNDEWLIVYILKEVSKQYEDAVVAVSDNDGDFLLIEAAMELPSWVDPSNSNNRAYIHQGRLHLIPLPKSPAEIMHIPNGKLSRSRAVDIVRSRIVQTQAPAAMEEAAFHRIKGYPGKAAEERHRARCTIPTKLAYVLLTQPQLIPHAVEVFYLRDPSNMKAASRMATFPPNDQVTTVVDMTKTTYAQLMSQQFYAPKSFTMPSRSNKRKFDAAELGMKLACAFEMLYSDRRINIEMPTQDTTVDQYDFQNDNAWLEYKKRLERRGYFKGELDGSARYRELESIAKQQHLSNLQQGVKEVDEEVDTGNISTLTKNSTLQYGPQKEIDCVLQHYSESNVSRLLQDAEFKQEDDDSWMNVNPQDLEDLLKHYGGLNMNSDELPRPEGGNELDLEAMMSKFESFVKYEQSGVEGAEFPKETMDEFSDDDDDDVDDDEDGYESDNDDISFDPNRFMDILKSTLGISSEEFSLESNKQPATEELAAALREISDEEAERIQKDSETKESSMESIYNDMDAELHGHTKINASFHKSVRFQPAPDAEEGDEDDVDIEEDEDAPVDIELNLVRNMLDSFKSQEGLPGPIGNIMNRMGIVIPRDEASMESISADQTSV